MNARWLGLVAAAAATLLAGTARVDASCGIVGPAPSLAAQINSANVAFVGLVEYTSDENRTARVKVESIWKGPSLPAYVDVHGEAPGSGPFSYSEGDHRYESGERYLFIPLNHRPPFEDYGDCNSSTQPYTAAIAADAPTDGKSPDAPSPADAIGNVVGRYSSAAPIGLLVLVAAAWIVGVRVRRRAKLRRR